jgi:glycosyltransferase involved in cell wall biosynthesis
MELRAKEPNQVKLIARLFLQYIRGIIVTIEAIIPRKRKIAVNYAWAKTGNIGGPFVKISRLEKYFPSHTIRYNILYSLSNHPSLPRNSYLTLKKRGIKIVHNQNGIYYPAWYDGDWKKKNANMAIPYLLADKVIFQSEFCKRHALEFLGKPTSSSEVLYNAVDTNIFKPKSAKLNTNNITYLVTGAISNHLYYRLESTILSFWIARKSISNAYLLVAGFVEAEAQQRADSLAKRLSIDKYIKYYGVYDQINAPALYRLADIYIMLKHNDPCPNVVIEAMASGLPVVYSDSGGVPELVGNESGISVACKDSTIEVFTPNIDETAEAMVNIFKNYQIYTNAARKRAVEMFDIQLWINRHKNIFLELLGKSK